MGGLGIRYDDVDALRADGRVVHIRDLGPGDLAGLRALQARSSDRSIYLRYFSSNRNGANNYLQALAAAPSREHHALGAFAQGGLVGVAAIERVNEISAEFALLVADDAQHNGLGTLLLEHLAAVAQGLGIRRLVADVLVENALMLEVLRNLGFASTSAIDSGSMRVEMLLESAALAIPIIDGREQAAESASLRPLLSPRSIAVIGAGGRAGSVGHEVLRNIVEAGFTGTVHVVNPNRSAVLGIATVPSAHELPIAPDLAIVAVPAARVANVVRQCGQRGVRVVLLLTAGFGESGPAGIVLQDEVLAIAREHGMRLVGPNCVGIVNTDPDVRLDATFALLPRRPGQLAVLAQSGAFGVGLLTAADRVGLGISQFVSVGNKADVGGNDLLLAWADDPRTRVIGMYLESIGDPLRFARIARRVSRHKPIIAVKSGRTEAGQRAGRSHTAAAASSEVAIDALFRSAGVLRVRTMQEMLDAARVLTGQPLPAGPRIAIVGNSGGPEILAADTASEAGLVVGEFDDATRELLRRAGAPVQNPIDLGAAAGPDVMAACLAALLASPSVDSVLTVFTDLAVTEAETVRRAAIAASATSDKPIVCVEVGAPSRTIALPDGRRSLPVFTFPEPAAAALAVAYEYRTLRDAPDQPTAAPADVDRRAAAALVDAALAEGIEWLGSDEVAQLLGHYGIEVCPQRVADGADEAAAAAIELGYPVALKLARPGLHKSDIGGVRLGIGDEAALRHEAGELGELGQGTSLLVQPMIARGTELIVGAVHDRHFGPLVMLGAGGVLTELLGDRAFRPAPLSDAEADGLISALKSAPLLDGYRGAAPASRAAVRDVLVRIAALVGDVPQVAELDLNPLVCRGEQALVVDARIRIAAPPEHPDPFVRRLRGPSGHSPAR